ncbi:MAG: NAD(P)H-binding protein, partial [Elusimicrobiota bacterium]
MATKPIVAVAGATGFVGQALVRTLCADHRVVGLSRNPPQAGTGPDVEWRRCDLFSLMQVEKALEGAQQAVYLVHSMMPSARLTQGNFSDMDLICADNFARAAARAGVRHIVYLGGLIPDASELSQHLRSRLEVEAALGSRGVPVTALRAGIVIGPGGSSYKIFKTLVEKVPLLLCPAWADSLTQPVALPDVLELLRYCLAHPARVSCSHDIGSPDVMSYRQLLERTAAILGLRRV